MRRLFEGDTYSSLITVIGNLRVYYIKGKLLLHLGQNVITVKTLLHLGSFITFRPSTSITRVTINWRDTSHFDSEDDYRLGCGNVSHCRQQWPGPGPGRLYSTYLCILFGSSFVFVFVFFLSGDRFRSLPVLAYSTVITVLFRRTSGRMGRERAGDW